MRRKTFRNYFKGHVQVINVHVFLYIEIGIESFLHDEIRS